jgi:hypothetical protein
LPSRSSPERRAKAATRRRPPPPLRGYGATAFACQKARWLAESKLAAGERRLVAQIFTRWNRIVDWLWQIAGKPHKQSSQQLTVLWVFSQTASGKAIVRRRP